MPGYAETRHRPAFPDLGPAGVGGEARQNGPAEGRADARLPPRWWFTPGIILGLLLWVLFVSLALMLIA
ncbi:hypothetical protein [Sagittula salina]|uniref:Uncharacterized protein n=1 Tax=Sagittula salina TaxID=2820268 RepID=A0A940MTR1_9RHOB|nr:hypothetical protein [Sagittula salina]MBP0484493.1 hypothetical protein [Sagittula salina]